MRPAVEKSWGGVLRKSEIRRVRAVLKKVRRAVASRGGDSFSSGVLTLANGEAGMALAEGLQAGVRGDRASLARARRRIKRCSEYSRFMDPEGGLFEGAEGIRAAGALLGVRSISKGARFPFFEGSQNFDLISGSVGVSISRLISARPGERAALSKALLGKIQKIRKRKGLAPFLHRQKSWMAPESWNQFRGMGPVFDYGTAHGTPGVLVMLAALASNLDRKHSKLFAATRNLAEDLIDQLERHRPAGCVPAIHGIRFLNLPPRGRVAWCYGELSFAIGLFQAGRVFRERAWVDLGILISLEAAKKQTPEAAGIGQGPGFFCHGGAGNAHIFARFYQWTGLKEFKNASRHWYTFACDQLEGEVFKSPLEQGFLNGLEGACLTLLWSLLDKEPDWDAVFGLSLP